MNNIWNYLKHCCEKEKIIPPTVVVVKKEKIHEPTRRSNSIFGFTTSIAPILTDDPMYETGIPVDMIDVTIFDVEKVKPFNMDDLQLRCKVSQVYDADTCTLILPFYGKPFEVKCRLNGIDTAEVRSKNLAEKAFALEARDYLRNLILGKIVWVNCGKMDKYGRLLGDIYTTQQDMLNNTNSLSDLLLDKKYAYVYKGGKKVSFSEWKDQIDIV
jgi:endonuclease YncB( thermonuclease family)